jgi:hypothetical protein
VGVLVVRILYSEVFLNLTEGFPCFFLSCKANARVKLTNTGRGPHSFTLVVICVVRLLSVLFYVSFVGKCVLLPGDNPIAVNKYIIMINVLFLQWHLPWCTTYRNTSKSITNLKLLHPGQ